MSLKWKLSKFLLFSLTFLTLNFINPTLNQAIYWPCCLSDNTCVSETLEDDCTSWNGTWQPVETCTDFLCLDLGICCTRTAECISYVNETYCTETLLGSYLEDTDCTDGLCEWAVKSYVWALPIPVTLEPDQVIGTDSYYTITLQEFKHQFHPAIPNSTLWGYNGMFPGPTIEAKVNNTVIVTWVNDIRDGDHNLRTEHFLNIDVCNHGPNYWGKKVRTSAHLHGIHTHARYDGHPEFTIFPGENDTFVYYNDQRASLMYFHDHALGITRLNVAMGLAGMYFLRDNNEDWLELPSREYEIPLLIMDFSILNNGSIYFPTEIIGQATFNFFHHFTVNGVLAPFLEVKQTMYRFRMVNACVARFLNVAFLLNDNTTETFYIIGSDGGLLSETVPSTGVDFYPGERLDIVFDFSKYEVGDEIELYDYFSADFDMDLIKFIVISSDDVATFELPEKLIHIEPLNETDIKIIRTFLFGAITYHDYDRLNKPCLSNDGIFEMATINRGSFDVIEDFIEKDTIELWELIPTNLNRHPVHIHGVKFQVLLTQEAHYNNTIGYYPVEVYGNYSSSYLKHGTWKDVIYPEFYWVTKVLVKFGSSTGRFVVHCHALNHEDYDMMLQFRIINKHSDCVINGICETNEDCISCPEDCAWNSGAFCGNKLCEMGNGENCSSCPDDCAFGELENGTFCCGDNTTACSEDYCITTYLGCRTSIVVDVCCGDSVCDPGSSENSENCPVDCANITISSSYTETTTTETVNLSDSTIIGITVGAIFVVVVISVIGYINLKKVYVKKDMDYHLLDEGVERI